MPGPPHICPPSWQTFNGLSIYSPPPISAISVGVMVMGALTSTVTSQRHCAYYVVPVVIAQPDCQAPLPSCLSCGAGHAAFSRKCYHYTDDSAIRGLITMRGFTHQLPLITYAHVKGQLPLLLPFTTPFVEPIHCPPGSHVGS